MRISHSTKQTIKSNITIILLFLAIFIVPMVTTMLLDLNFIKQQLVRKIIVYLLLLIEVVIFVYLLKITIEKEIKK